MRRASAVVSLLLLLLLSLGIAEAALLAMLLLFGSILHLYLAIEIGGQTVSTFAPFWIQVPQVGVHNGGTVASFVFTLACGLAAAMWRYRHWKPAV